VFLNDGHKMNKIILLSVVLITFAFTSNAQNSSGSIGGDKIDNEIRVPIYLNNSINVGSLQIRLDYDPVSVSVYSDPTMDKGELTDFYAPDNSHNKSGYITISAMKFGSGGVSGNLTIGYVRLQAISSGSSVKIVPSILAITDDSGKDIIGKNVLNVAIDEKHEIKVQSANSTKQPDKDGANATIGQKTGISEPAGKILTEPVPINMISKTSDYITSLVGEGYFQRYLALTGNKSIQSGTGEITYNVLYSYDIPSDYLASPNPRHVTVSLDKNGNIIDYIGPKKPHTFGILREKVNEIAKQSGLKEPIAAEIDRVQGVSTDGYVWVATGAIDQEKCNNMNGTQECFAPGRYIDVDDGSLVGGFNRSSLIRDPSPAQTIKQPGTKSIDSGFSGIVGFTMLIISFIIKNKLKRKLE